MSVNPIPEGYHTVTPYVIVDGAADALEWYAKAFNATEMLRLPGPDGKLMHCEFKIGDSPIMMADGCPEMNAKGPQAYGGSPVSICLYVEDVDALFKQAIDAGGKELRPVTDQFYGDRMGTLEDPFGHTWSIGTHMEDLTEEEVGERFQAMMSQGAAPEDGSE